VLGGLMISTLFTIFVIPSLLLFFIGRETLRPAAEQMAGEEPYSE
jgi:predicted Na+-dependent transporter